MFQPRIRRSFWKVPARLGLMLALAVVPPAAASNRQDQLADIRAATARFHDLDNAIAAGYELGYVNGANMRIIAGCVSHATAGAMGYHYFHKQLIDDNVVNELTPEGLVYSPGPNGQLRLAAVEYVVPGALSNPSGVSEAPSLFGMDMVILVPAVGWYTRHAWIWSNNPAGIFAHWSPAVSCA